MGGEREAGLAGLNQGGFRSAASTSFKEDGAVLGVDDTLRTQAFTRLRRVPDGHLGVPRSLLHMAGAKLPQWLLLPALILTSRASFIHR